MPSQLLPSNACAAFPPVRSIGRSAGSLAACLLIAGFLSPARAGILFYSGNLRADATVVDCGAGCTLGIGDTDADFAQWAAVLTNFTVSTAGPVQAITYGFGGGTSLGGNPVAAGGFEPYLSLFDSSGDFLLSTYFGTTCPPGANAVFGNCYDVLLDAGVLAPGSYTLALTAFANLSFAENLGTGTLADGFTGFGNLAAGENLAYAFDLVLPGAAVPEPSSGALVAVCFAALLILRSRAPDLVRVTISRLKKG
jgi:hypothetical protein